MGSQHFEKSDGQSLERPAEKRDTRGGGTGCSALRHLQRKLSLAGMQILAGKRRPVYGPCLKIR